MADINKNKTIKGMMSCCDENADKTNRNKWYTMSVSPQYKKAIE